MNWNRTYLLMGAGVVASFVGGTVAGYFFAQRKLAKKYEEITEMEIREAKEFYSVLHKKQFDTPEDAVKALVKEGRPVDEIRSAVEALASYQGSSEGGVTVNGEDVHNVFEDGEDVEDIFDYELEAKHRTPDHPYVITMDEFMSNEKEYEQGTVTYFEGDDVLVDSRDQTIDDKDNIVGEDNLVKFGYGSKDKNIVYVRNDRIEMEIEIVLSKGNYAEEVLGFIEHSHKEPKIRRFRGDNE